MITVSYIEDLRKNRQQLLEPVGFVPTMGYLHEGHLSLVREARKRCKSVVASVYVNPTQFGPSEDLAKYPRDLARDEELLKNEGVDVLWTPSDLIMYPPGYQTWVTVDKVTQVLEGAARPTHFRGVTTVVTKLLLSVLPQMAFFGQKDAQQVVVIKRMVMDLNIPVELVVCPIAREKDGLALSSRNVFLSPAERNAAPILRKSLLLAKQLYLEGERNTNVIKQKMMALFNAEPLCSVQYISIADFTTLEETETILDNQVLVSMAVYFGATRLIDNILLPEG